MYQLHIGNKNYSSWSLRPWVLMRELGIEFTECLHLFNGANNQSSFMAFNPAGLVPCLIDNNETLWDSLAIIEYLAERHNGVWSSDPSARAWSRCAAAEMHSGFSALRSHYPMSCGLRIEPKLADDALKKDIQRIDELWCEGLTRFKGPFLAGECFSAVDAFFAPIVFRFQTYHPPLSAEAQEYMQRILDVAAMQQWYSSALAEPYRDELHESESEASGRIVNDFRNLLNQ